MSIIILYNHFHAFRLAIYGNSILLFLIYFPISVSGFDLTFHPLVIIFDFYYAKVSQAGNTANTGTSPIDGKLFMTLRNQRLRFPENFYRPILCLRFP